MQKLNILKYFAFIFLLHSSFAYCAISYKVQYNGLQDPSIISEIISISDLENLKDHPLRSINALRYRISADIPLMIKVMHSLGYYDAQISSDIENDEGIIIVYININPGTRYLLKKFDIYEAPCDKKIKFEMKDFTLKGIGVDLNTPITAQNVIDSEKALIYTLIAKGHPLAYLKNRDILADVKTKEVFVDLCVDKGKLARFGETTIKGLKNINSKFLNRKILWKEGNVYSPQKVEETQTRLLQSDLFSSVVISHDEKIDDKDKLGMNINLMESKHKSISIGASYETIFGPGISFSWANRNFRGFGELLSIDADVTKKTLEGIATYLKPDFVKLDQDYLLRFIAQREKLHLYLSRIYSIKSRLDTKIDKNTYFSWGVKGEYDEVSHSHFPGSSVLFSVPLFTKFTTTTELLEITNGYTITYKASPYLNVANTNNVFLKQRLIQEFYYATTPSKRAVLAFRLLLGSITGAKTSNIPMTKLFLGGSDDNLRGYRYRTVGPRDKWGNITGGRGAIYFTIEPRFKITKTIGIVPFADFGNVTKKEYPMIKGEWKKSVGVGFRYYTFFGPIRFDVGVPLDRRVEDPKYRIYISIGQTF
jgi:translocation and assembly module TamA